MKWIEEHASIYAQSALSGFDGYPFFLGEKKLVQPHCCLLNKHKGILCEAGGDAAASTHPNPFIRAVDCLYFTNKCAGAREYTIKCDKSKFSQLHGQCSFHIYSYVYNYYIIAYPSFSVAHANTHLTNWPLLSCGHGISTTCSSISIRVNRMFFLSGFFFINLFVFFLFFLLGLWCILNPALCVFYLLEF